jgi:4-amino-4-deoxy-L-arabinose transferase-like glycosyltransferase
MLAAVLLLAAGVRLVSYLQVRDGSILYAHWAPDTDMNFYDAWARGIVAGDLLGAPRPYHPWHHEIARDVHAILAPGQPFDDGVGRRMWDRWLGPYAFYQDPLYAYALAAVYAVAGARPEPVVLWQGLLGLGIVAFVFTVGCALWDRTVGLIAGLIAALYAPLIFYETTLLRGALQAFLAMAAVTFATLGMQRTRRSWWALAGAAAGLAALAHATNVLLAAALALYPLSAWLRHRREARSDASPEPSPQTVARRAVLAYAACFLLALAPLFVRNVIVGASPWSIGPAGAYGAFNFISGHAVDSDPRLGFPFSPSAARIFAATDARLLPVMRATLATHPSFASWARRMGAKVLAFWDGWENADNINFYYFLLHSPFVAIVGIRFALLAPLGMMGLALSGRRALSPPAAAVACGLIAGLVFFTSSRVRLTAAVALIPFAAAALVETARRIRSGRSRSIILPAAAGLITAVVAAAPWWPREHVIRELDYITGNTIARIRANEARQQADVQAAARIFDKQLSTEPEPLRRIDPTGSFSLVPEWAARLAGSFAELHGAAADLHASTGAPERAAYHARRAQVLSVVAAQYAERVRAVQGTPTP